MLKNATEIVEEAKRFISDERLDCAERKLLSAINRRIDTKEVYFLLGDIYLRKNYLGKAEEAFRKAVSLDSSDYLSLLNLGNICIINGNLKGTEQYLSSVLENSPEYREYAIPLLGDTYYGQNKYYLAYLFFETALKNNTEDEDLLYKAGCCLMNSGFINLARDYLKKVLSINSQNEKARRALTSLEGKSNCPDKICIEEGTIKIFKLLKQYYPEPTAAEESYLNSIFSKNYEKNLSLLQLHYPHLYERVTQMAASPDLHITLIADGVFDLLRTQNGHKVWMHGFSHPFRSLEDLSTIYKKEQAPCLFGMATGQELKILFHLSSPPIPSHPGLKIPIYVIEPSFAIFKINLKLRNFSDLLESGRVFFFLGENCMNDFLDFIQNDYTFLPQRITLLDNTIADMHKACIQKYRSIIEKKQSETKSLMVQINDYYNTISDQEWQRIYSSERSRPLRILGITSRYTTFLQYCMRDVIDGFNQLGCETHLLIEPSDVNIVYSYIIAKTIWSFKPDLIFIIDTNRSHFTVIHQNIPFISWVQDHLERIFNSQAGTSIGKKDFFLVLMSGWINGTRSLCEYSYPPNKLKQQIIPANEHIYKPIRLTTSDSVRYGCDVSFVKHGALAPELCLEELLNLIPDTMTKRVVKALYEIVQERFLNEQDCFKEDYLELITRAEELIKEKIRPELRETIFHYYYYKIGDGFIRQLPIERITQMGVRLKLFGKDWEKHPRLSRYACGPVENGAELNKLFNATKINLQLHFAGTTNQRFVEGAASGGFFLVKHLKQDDEPIAHHYQEGEEFIYFYSLKDLEEKIIYYLNREEERKRIGNNAHKKTLEKYTYKIMCEDFLKIISRNPNNISI